MQRWWWCRWRRKPNIIAGSDHSSSKILILAVKINSVISLLQSYDVGYYTRARRNNTGSNGEEGVHEEGRRDTSLWTL